MRPRKAVILTIILGLSLSIALVAGTAEARTGGPVEPGFVPGEIWIKPSPDVSSNVLTGMPGCPDATVEAGIPQLGWVRLRVPEGEEEEYLARVSAQPYVQDATLNHVARALEIPNDEKWSAQWNMRVIRAVEAWDVVTTTTGIIIAVVDTGVEIAHPDLQANIWTNAGEIPGNKLDDDGNGYADDVHGWNFVASDGNVTDTYGEDGHGTHVAGIAAATGNNGVGVAGLCWSGAIMSVRVLDDAGEGDYADIAAGITYAAENGARIINLSLGGTASSPLLYDAVLRARGWGCLVVAAAGNCADPASLNDEECSFQINPPFYPAAQPETLAVGATDGTDRWAPFSEHHDYVDLSAPGTGICSTCPQGLTCFQRGTSMATPHVAGLAALVWTLRPDLSSQQVQRVIEGWAEDVNAEEHPGKDAYLGWGRINAYQAVLNARRGTTLTLESSHQTLQVGGAQATVRVTLTTEYGYGADGTPVNFSTTLGYVFPPDSTLVDGAATTAFAGGPRSGDAEIRAEVAGITNTVIVHVEPAEPYAVSVNCNPGLIAADGGTATVVVTVSDRFGNAVLDGTDVYLATTLGSISPAIVQTYEGRVTAYLTGEGQAGVARVTADAISAGGWTEALLYTTALHLPIIQKETAQPAGGSPSAPAAR